MRFVGAAASRQACQRQRRTHQLQEIAAVDGIIPFRSLARKFAVQQSLKMRIIRQLFQRAPILFAGFFLQFFADSGEVQLVFAQRVVFDIDLHAPDREHDPARPHFAARPAAVRAILFVCRARS